MTQVKKIRVSLDNLPADVWLEAFTTGATWNGAATPAFTHEVGIELTKHMQELTFDEVNDQFVYSSPHEDGPQYYPSRTTEIDGVSVKVYDIGSFGWCWFTED